MHITPRIHHFSPKLSVFFFVSQAFTIDYGTTHIITLSDIYELSAMFQDYPPQAILFTIANVTADDVYFDSDILQNVMVEADVKYGIIAFCKCSESNKTVFDFSRHSQVF